LENKKKRNEKKKEKKHGEKKKGEKKERKEVLLGFPRWNSSSLP
jgi:hypothetical protein